MTKEITEMIFKHPNLIIEEGQHEGDRCLRFSFMDKFTEAVCHDGTRAWLKYVEEQNTPIVLIWDCTQMKGFELSARRDWIDCLNEVKATIRKVVVISDDIIIRGSASLMLKLYPFESTVIRSEKHLDLSLNIN